MGVLEDPLSSLWFNILVLILPLIIFFIAIYILKLKYKEDLEPSEEKPRVTIY